MTKILFQALSYREIHSTYVGEQEHQGKKYAEMSEAYVRVIAQ